MKLRITSAALAVGMTAGALLATGAPAQAEAAEPAAARAGNTSLAEVLGADGNKFDNRNKDFDILDRAVRVVLKNKPESAVAVLADGKTRLTAFAPTDRAFKRLVEDLTGDHAGSEKKTFVAIKSVADIDTLEAVLLYHVVPGATITSGQAVKADDAVLATAQGGEITVNVTKKGIWLKDADTDDRNPKLIGELLDLNKGNKQIAHGISRVLRPIDL